MALRLTHVEAKLGGLDASRRQRLDEFEIAAAVLALRLLHTPERPELVAGHKNHENDSGGSSRKSGSGRKPKRSENTLPRNVTRRPADGSN